MSATVRQVLDGKQLELKAVSPDTTVFNALALMAECNIGAVLVLEDDKLAGIFTERDYARKVVLKGLRSADVSVRELMTASPVTIAPSQTIDDVMALMTNHRFRHLPVVDGDRVVGIITIGDVVKCVIDSQAQTIEHLSNYISGNH